MLRAVTGILTTTFISLVISSLIVNLIIASPDDLANTNPSSTVTILGSLLSHSKSLLDAFSTNKFIGTEFI